MFECFNNLTAKGHSYDMVLPYSHLGGFLAL